MLIGSAIMLSLAKSRRIMIAVLLAYISMSYQGIDFEDMIEMIREMKRGCHTIIACGNKRIAICAWPLSSVLFANVRSRVPRHSLLQ